MSKASVRRQNKAETRQRVRETIVVDPPVDKAPINLESVNKANQAKTDKEYQTSLALVHNLPALPVIPTVKTHPVRLFRDVVVTYKDLYLTVFVAGDHYEERNFAEMFARSNCQKSESVDGADVVVFTGGVDVNPALYGELAHPTTDNPNEERDNSDIALYAYCLEHGIPMMGICRGAQFLHVMNGGKLYQHVDGHNKPHAIWDVISMKQIDMVSSVHHQMIIPDNRLGIELIATSNAATSRWRNPRDNDMGKRADVEAFFYRKSCCLGFQGHPEYHGYPHYTAWCLEKMEAYFNYNPDLKLDGGNYRVLPERRKANVQTLSELNEAPFDD